MGMFNKNKIYLFDGSKGYMLQKYGLNKAELAESYNITNPDIVRRIYSEYCDAGSDIIQTNTLCSNRLILERHNMADKLDLINKAGVSLAKEAVGNRDILVAASIGPIGELLQPSGSLSFDQAYELFVEQLLSCKDADLINFETFTDLKEMRIALLANIETINLPVICNMTYEKNDVTMMGHTPFICSGILKKMGSDVVGVNCSNGPEKMSKILMQMACFEDFLCVKPNAGVPSLVDDNAFYGQTKEDFCCYSDELLQYNIGITGGCCGTTPEYIKHMNYVKKMARTVSIPIDNKKYIFSQFSYLDTDSCYKTYEWTIKDQDINDCIDIAYDINEDSCDAYIIKYCGKDKAFFLKVIDQVQDVLKKPLIFSCDDQVCLESALKVYCGIAGISKGQHGKFGSIAVL